MCTTNVPPSCLQLYENGGIARPQNRRVLPVPPLFGHHFESIRRTAGIKRLRYDGTVNAVDRKQIHRKFSDPDEWAPVLITAGAGGVGLNIQAASIVIQTEI